MSDQKDYDGPNFDGILPPHLEITPPTPRPTSSDKPSEQQAWVPPSLDTKGSNLDTNIGRDFGEFAEEDVNKDVAVGDLSSEAKGSGAVTINSIKDSNPKDALGIAKVPMSTVPVPVMMEIALGLMEGGLKYGRHNYRAIGIRFSVYYDAAMRHLGAWWEGEDIDADSGLSHVTKAIATLVVLRDAMIRDKFVDDRPPGTSGFIEKLNQKAAKLLEMYPEPKDPFLGTDYPPTEYKG